MAKKPLYGKVLVTRSFARREDAVSFAEHYKEEYKQADMSLKFDIQRTASSEWTATIYVKI